MAMGSAISMKLAVTCTDFKTSGSPTSVFQLSSPINRVFSGRTSTRSVNEAPSDTSIGPAKNRTKPTSQGAMNTSPQKRSRRASVPPPTMALDTAVYRARFSRLGLVIDGLQRVLQLQRFGVHVEAGRCHHQVLEVGQRLARLQIVRQRFLVVRIVDVRQAVHRHLPVDLHGRELLVQRVEKVALHCL